jgi:hypothetical protein
MYDEVSSLLYIVTYTGWLVTYRRVLDWMIGFTDTLFTQLVTTGCYRVIAEINTYSSPLHTH